MIVCIDTNVLVQARASGHAYYPILDAWIAGSYSLAVSTGILLEYEEIITLLSGKTAWFKFARLLDLVDLTSSGVVRVTPFYRFNVIGEDPDDNLFTDCAISAGAEYLITEDRHFLPLASAEYLPKPITPQVFMDRFGLSPRP
ncbi:MAG: putative toxin-antitoxin system toxin component, PIN family [Luteolibacter sp.]